MGRPSKLTKATTDRVVEAIQAGASQDVAARHGGIVPSTHYEWLRRGREAHEQARTTGRAIPKASLAVAEYSERIDHAVAEWELSQLSTILEAGVGRTYVTVRTVERQELTKDGTVVTLTTTTTEEGEKADWKALAALLRWRNPRVYGDRIDVTGRLSPEQQADLITRTIEGVLDELGVATTPQVGRVVSRHLELVADDADRMAS